MWSLWFFFLTLNPYLNASEHVKWLCYVILIGVCIYGDENIPTFNTNKVLSTIKPVGRSRPVRHSQLLRGIGRCFFHIYIGRSVFSAGDREIDILHLVGRWRVRVWLGKLKSYKFIALAAGEQLRCGKSLVQVVFDHTSWRSIGHPVSNSLFLLSTT